MRPAPLRALGCLVGAGLVGGCASASAGSAALVCESPRVTHARSLTEYMDSSALALELERWGPATGLTVARVSPDSTGAASALVASAALDEADRDRLEEILERHTRVIPPRRDPLALEVGTSGGMSPRRLDGAAQCRPVLQNTGDIRRGIAREARRLDLSGRESITVRMLVERDGTVADAHIYRGSGSPVVDGAMLDVMRGAVFSPSRFEGIPVAVWVELPVNVNVEEPPPPPEAPLFPPEPPDRPF